MKYTVYAISHPTIRPETPVYVGLTSKSPQERLAGHVISARSGKMNIHKWIAGLLKDGLYPSASTLCEVDGRENGLASERAAIVNALKINPDLLNVVANEKNSGSHLCPQCLQPIPTPEELERRRARQRRWQAKMRARAKSAGKVSQNGTNRPESAYPIPHPKGERNEQSSRSVPR